MPRASKKYSHSMRPTRWLAAGLLPVLVFVAACRTTHVPTSSGIQESYRGYVPARISVLPCQVWPNTARFASQPLTTTDQTVTDNLCQAIDAFVIDGFQDQPFMSGFSPRAVGQLLELAEKEDLLDQFASNWVRDDRFCLACNDALSVYAQGISQQQNWRLWSQELSQATRKADAALIPLIVYATEAQLDDRGLAIAKREAQVVLLLVDTNNGKLVWAATNKAEISTQKLQPASSTSQPNFPEWEELYPRLLLNSLWLDFPGRQYD